MSDVRLIDANAMRDEWLENGENEYVYDTNAVLASIDGQPTIEAVPVRHGRLEGNHSDFKCSACGTAFHDDILWIQGDRIVPKYCPECGVRWAEVLPDG